MDSQSCQRFCRLPYGASISKATLAENLGKIEPGTWKAINDHLVRWAQARGLEKGQRIRVDATAVQTHVHYPLDSELLYDGIRVVTRWLGRLRDWEGIGFVDHTRRAKRRVLNIRNPPRQEAPGELPRSDQGGVQDGPLCRAGAGRVGAVERSPQSGRGGATGPLSGAVAPSHRADSTTGPFGRGRRGPGEDLFPLRRAHRYYQEEGHPANGEVGGALAIEIRLIRSIFALEFS